MRKHLIPNLELVPIPIALKDLHAFDYCPDFSLVNLLHHQPSHRRCYLLAAAIDPDRLDPSHDLGGLCAESVHNR